MPRCRVCGSLREAIAPSHCQACHKRPPYSAQPDLFNTLLLIPRCIAWLMRTPSLRQLALWPMLLTTLLLILLLGFGLKSVLAPLQQGLSQSLPAQGWLFALKGLLLAFAMFSFVVLFLFLFLPVSTLLCLPFLDLLSQAAEKELLQTQDLPNLALPWRILIQEMLTLMAFKLLLLLLGLPLLLLPVVGPLLYLILLTLLTALDFLDLVLTRKAYSFLAKLRFIQAHFGRFLLFSAPLLLFSWVPILQILLLPAAALAGVRFYLDSGPFASEESPIRA